MINIYLVTPLLGFLKNYSKYKGDFDNITYRPSGKVMRKLTKIAIENECLKKISTSAVDMYKNFFLNVDFLAFLQ